MKTKRRINVLCTLLLLSLALGLVSFCTSGDFKEGWTDGEQDAFEEYSEMTGSKAYGAGYNVGRNVAEKINRKCMVKLIPTNYSEYPEDILNTASRKTVSMSLRDIRVLLPDKTNKNEWISTVFVTLTFFAGIFFVWLLFSFVSAIKGGEIFIKDNEWKLRSMAGVFILWFIAEFVANYIEYAFIRANIAFEGYKVVMYRPSIYPLAIGITFLLFAEIFKMGRQMKEDQEFMV